MENQLKQRILKERFSGISLAESIEISPHRHPRPKPNPHSFQQLKKVIASIMILGFLIYRFLFESPQVDCLFDLTHQMTEWLNKLANSSSLFYNIISIVSQEAIEVEIVVMVLLAVIRLQNLRVHMFMGAFYGLRALHLHIEKLPFPEGIVSYPPVFPCFSVPYGITRDFYYSGHTGLMLFSVLLWRRLKYRKLEVVTYPLLVVVVLVLLVTRVHYGLDLVGGVVFTLWINRFLLPHVQWFDYAFTLIYKGIGYVYAALRAALS